MHLNRTAEAGALSASFAHELSQPLVAAMLNAETVERLLRANLPEWARAKAAIANTQQAIKHAAEIIQHLKKLLKRRSEPLPQEFNLNEAIADALCMLSPEAQSGDKCDGRNDRICSGRTRDNNSNVLV